ncbi:hypothetical protein [Campylobacter sp. RM12651]|uniref:hypothetical protein n=1 Tax=Campylobacter sp. RM12651 TaxID=1660079 RepID=UPI001EFAEA65|nr:hypothetical protein [Campylobacter sp. RM12651]ULO03729.1 hypothetical protein AVBRAN_1274 [Campylobacter sp. RM12651]
MAQVKFIIEDNLENIVEKNFNTLKDTQSGINRGYTKESKENIVKYLTMYYTERYCKKEPYEENIPMSILDDMEYGFDFALGFEKAKEIMSNYFHSELWKYLEDIALDELENKGISITEENIEKTIEEYIQAGASLDEDFIEYINGFSTEHVEIINYDKDKKEEVFVVIRTSY